MHLFHKISDTKAYLSEQKKKGLQIGFVPTMGALHKGHLTLLEKAKKENDLCVCSMFVNPIQFNNAADLTRYPRPLEKDILFLNSIGCDVLFQPSVEEMYPEPNKIIYDLNGLDKTMEGAFRPGHFNGVAVVVKKLFDIMEPNRAYFGEKDFQQLAIIKYLVKVLRLPIQIIPVATIRESDGLAMSSRNQLLTPLERKAAPHIYQTLLQAKEKITTINTHELKEWVIKEINRNSLMKTEYFEVVNIDTLRPASERFKTKNTIGCIAVNMGKVRLIDNIKFF